MKILILLCIAGYALASELKGIYWEPHTEYTFEYSGRLLSGLPELASHYSGMGIKCKVHCKIDRTGESYKFGIHITEPRYVRVNNELQANDTMEGGNNWRYVLLPSFHEVPSEHARNLASPVVLELKHTGEFKVLVVSGEEPEWSINFKKALASMLQTDLEVNERGSQEIVSNELRESPSSVPRPSWTVMEESLDGMCEVNYQMNELPSYVIRDLPNLIPYPEICQGEDSKYYELIKTRNVDNCERRTSFTYYKPGFFRCPEGGNCEGMWSRSSVTRYITCSKSSTEDLRIQTIINEGELQQNLFGIKTEKFVTGTKQVLKLINVRPSSGGIRQPVSSRILNTLYYEYSTNTRFYEEGPGSLSGSVEESDVLKGLPRHSLPSSEGKDIDPTRLMTEIKRLFKQLINEDLHDLVNLPKKQITMKSLNIARSLAMLKRDHISSIYQDLKTEFSSSEDKKTTFKNLFFDTLVMGGTKECVLFLTSKINSGELSTTQMISIFAFLPHYVMVPNESLLGNLYHLITSSTIKEKPYVYNHAIMSFSKLIQRACLSENRKTSYPTWVMGKKEFCSPYSSIVTEMWLPYLQRELQESHGSNPEKTNLVLVALGLMSHRNVIPMVLPYVERTVTPVEGDRTPKSLTRFLAVYSLSTSGRRNPYLVEPVLMSVLTNVAENSEIRIAAFNVLMKLNPSMTVIQAIAASTWHERDTEVLNVINTAFFTLATQDETKCMTRECLSLHKKVWLVYPMIKKTGGRYPTSASIMKNDHLPILGVGHETVLNWIGSKDSILPSDIYNKVVYLLNRYQFTAMEFGMRLKGGESIAQELVDILTPGGYGGSKESIKEQVKEQIHSEWREAIEKLGIKDREGETPEGSIYLNMFEDFTFFRSFETTSRDMLKEKIESVLGGGRSGLKERICGHSKVNFQRTHCLSPFEFTIPSDMGLPMLIEVHMPMTVSIKGDMDVQCSSNSVLPTSVKMNVRTLYASQLTGWVGTVCPFTQEFVVTGVDEHSVINMPTDISLSVNVPEKKLNMKIKPITSLSGPIDVLHFHIRPYTVVQKLYDLTPMTLSSQVKFIKSRTQPKELTYPFGEMYGLDLKVLINSESRFLDFRSVIERLRMYNYNPLNVLRFNWASTALSETGRPSIRKHEFQVKYNPSQSTTNEIDFNLECDWVTKYKGEECKTHKIEVSSEGKIVPFKIEKVPVGFSHSEGTKKLKTMVEQNGLQDGTGVNLRLSTILSGSRRRSWTHSLKLVVGQESELRSKWNVHLERENTGEKLCIRGDLEMPLVPTWKIEEIRNSNIEFKYNNEIGMGQDCSQSKVKVTGTSRTSEKQKEFSKTSPEARLLSKMEEKNVPLTELSEVADKVRIQASTLDEVDFRVEYINVPDHVMRKSKMVINFLKAMWWPYYVNEESRYSSGSSHLQTSMTANWRFKFWPMTRTFDLSISRPDEKINFRHIRIPYPLGYFFPMNSVKNPIDVASKGLTGKPLHPICSLEKDWIKTFDNRTTKVHLDDCFHMMTADCSLYKRFSVMVRSLTKGSESKEIMVFIGKTKVLLTPSERHSRYHHNLVIRINGTETSVRPGQMIRIKDSKGHFVLSLEKSSDGITTLNSKWVKVTFDGYKTQVETSWLIKDKLCGLCGDLNNQKVADLRGPKKCVYSKPEIVTASYRVSLPSKRCGPLPGHVEDELRKETEECAKYKELPTKVTKSYKTATGQCTRHQHEILERQSKICFSKLPLPNCSPRCKPSQGAVAMKSVPFTCMNKGRTADLYVEKVRSGQVVRELQTRSTDFEVEMPLPKVCTPITGEI